MIVGGKEMKDEEKKRLERLERDKRHSKLIMVGALAGIPLVIVITGFFPALWYPETLSLIPIFTLLFLFAFFMAAAIDLGINYE